MNCRKEKVMMRAPKRTSMIAIGMLVVAMAAGPSIGVAQQIPSPAATSAPPSASPDTSQENSAPTSPGAAQPSDTLISPGGAANGQSTTSSPGPQTQARTDLPHNLSPWGMFMSADWIVKTVMIGLAFASLVTWTVFLAKAVEVACARARAKRAFQMIAASTSLEDAEQALVNRGGPAVFMVRSAGEELRRSARVLSYAGDGGVKERVVSRLARIEAQAGRRLTRGTGLLATIGATAPFVGLFGTVWGIMNSFIGISQSQTTNLAVVAPGIAEALLATALGLVAAIPAVVIYNVFARAVTGYRQNLADAAAGVEQLISLDLDVLKVPGAREHAAPAFAAE